MPRPKGPRGAGNPKFTIYARLVPKMHHIKFEKNWSSGYQEVKNVQMCTDTTHHVWHRPGGKTSTPRIMKFTISGEVSLLYIAMQLVFLTYTQFKRRRFLKNSSILTLFAPPQRPQGKARNLKFTIYAPLAPNMHHIKF